MRAFAAVFAREVFARRIVFPVALAAGFMPLVGSLAYGWSRPDSAEGRVLVALVTAAAFSFAFALLFGGSVIAGETSERRISFFFTRPISAAAIWGGKLLAVLVLAFVPGVLALVPAFATSTAATNLDLLRLGGAGWGLLGLFLATLFLVLGAHAVVTIARLRSPWVALDLLLAPALVLLAAAFLRSLLKDTFANDFNDGARLNVLSVAIGLLVAAVFAALLFASFIQVAEGRSDARRAHGAFSVVFFGILGTTVALGGGYAGWCASAKATDLSRVWNGQAAPRGSWVVAGGPLRAWRGGGTFLFDVSSGRSIRAHGWNIAFSRDGTRAAWGEPRFGFFEMKDTRADLVVADLASGRTFKTGLECANLWSDLALSPNGMRLALRDGKTFSAFDISSPANPKQLAVVNLEGEGRTFTFVDEDTLRLFPRAYNPRNTKELARASRELEIEEISFASKKSVVTGRIEGDVLANLRVHTSADGRFLVETRHNHFTLRDGRTGAILATLAENFAAPKLHFLSGGRMVVGGISNERGILKIFLENTGTQGPPPRLVDLGPAASLVLGGEVAPGRVAVALNPFRSNDERLRRAWKLAFVDVSSGVVSPGPDGLVPTDPLSWWLSPTLPPAEAGSPASSLFIDADSRLIRLDPATGAQTVLLGRSK